MKTDSSWPKRICRLLGSLKLAILILLTLAGVIAVATVLEADHGRPYAQWYVYHAPWFLGLLALLGTNIFFAAAIRWPWKRHQTGFVITHAGLLVLLAGSISTFVAGVEGQVSLSEGETATTMVQPQQTQITASWVERPEEPPYHFSFEPGPGDWGERVTLDFGKVDGVGARVLRYLRHSRAVETWVPDDSGGGSPCIKFQIHGPHPGTALEQLLVDQEFGDEVQIGPLRFELRRALNDAMLIGFQKPPEEKPGPMGLILAYSENKVHRLPVDANLGKKVLLENGIVLEIAEYLPHAASETPGKFRSLSKEPRNPLVELRIHVPRRERPYRQLAFAKSPLLNLDPITGESCPIKFEYHHPAVTPGNGVEFLQARDGSLHARVVAPERRTSVGKVSPGQTIALPGGFSLTLTEHFSHARPKVEFEPVEEDPKNPAEAAAEIEITAGGTTRTIWLQRNHSMLGTRLVATPEGLLRVKLGHGESPLGFALQLVKFTRDLNPGGVGNAAFSSRVRLLDHHRGVDEERIISMNEPLTHNKLTLYQSSFSEAGHGMATSVFSVARDPGRMLKYAGSLMICLGIVIMFYMRAYFFKSASCSGRAETMATHAESSARGQVVNRPVETESLSEKGSDPRHIAGSSPQSGEDTAGWARGLTPFRTDSDSPPSRDLPVHKWSPDEEPTVEHVALHAVGNHLDAEG